MITKSRLVLGTAALGMPYGVSNAGGPPTRAEAFEVLDAAFENGINTFDTASVYGDAEDIIGQWIALRHKQVFVISKMRPHDGGGSDFVISEIKSSLKRLRVDALDGYLVHRASDLRIPEVVAGLQDAQKRGLVANIGVSAYEESEAEYALHAGAYYLQIPYNIFDHRFGKTDFLAKAQERNVTIFARSPFLQGLLLMEPDQLPDALAAAEPYLKQFRAAASRHGASPLESALGFVLAEHRIPHIVVGAVSPAQVRELASVRAASPELVAEMHELFHDVPATIADPRLWKKS